jgi:hypothetical protein
VFHERLSALELRRTVATLFAIVLLATCAVTILGPYSNAADDPDPRSVEWVCKHAPERVRALFDSLNLGRTDLAKIKLAVDQGDYPSACHALIAYYKHAPTAKSFRRRPVEDNGKSDPRADRMLADQFLYYGEEVNPPRTAAGGIVWSYNGAQEDFEWQQMFNHQDYFNTLMAAYAKTGRRAYIERIDQDLRDWILSNPHPGRKTRIGPWGEVEVSSRARTWVSVFYGLQSVEEFSPAARILLLSSVAEHAQYLMLFHRRDSNNHTVAQVTTLGIIGCAWPEFRDASGWRAYAQEKVGQQMGALVYPDGAEAELTAGYHRISTETFDVYVRTSRDLGYPVADSITVGIKRMWTYLAFTLRPDGTTPENNDTDRRDIRDKLKEASKVHDRPDWAYIASNGREGLKPRIGPTVTFPWAGHAVMRSGWDADAQWAFFDASPFGVAHQHYDKLHLSIDAFGRALLVDAGRYRYVENDPFRDYFVSSAAHNVLLIDGAGQLKTPDRAERPMAGGDYGSMPDFDYARGIFDNGYQGVKGRIVHTRTVVYVRNQFWIVADRVETDRARKVEALWHYAPDCSVVVEGKTVVSTDAGKGNLRIVPTGGMPWRMSIVEGAENPVQGWYSGNYTDKEPNPTAVYSAEIPGTTTFAWVLCPVRGEVPTVDTRVLSSREDRIELRVQKGAEKAFVVTVPMNSWRPSVRREG